MSKRTAQQAPSDLENYKKAKSVPEDQPEMIAIQNPASADSLLILNDDCLLQVYNSSNALDLIQLSLMHPRLTKAFETTIGKRLCVDSAFVERFPVPVNMDMIKAIAPHVSRLELKKIPESYVVAILPYFKNMLELNFTMLELNNKHSIETFPQVKSLDLELYDTSKAYAQKLLQHFGPHLEVLRATSAGQVNDLSSLKKIRELEVDAFALHRKNAFFKRCKTLEFLKIDWGWCKRHHTEKECDMANDNIQLIAGIKSLKKLQMVHGGSNRITIWSMPKMSQVEEFIYSDWVDDGSYYTFLGGLDPTSLKSLSFEWGVDHFEPESLDMVKDLLPFTRLETLKMLFDTNWIEEPEYLDKLMIYKELKCLHIQLKSAELMLKVIKQMPQLMVVGNKHVPLAGKFQEDLVAYLKAAKRSLNYNSVLLP